MNWLRLLVGFYVSRRSGKVRQWGLPAFVSIEPTTSCNLRCPQCPSGLREFTRPTGMLQQEMFETSVSQLRQHVFSLTFYFQGEPYLNPAFLDLVKKAHEARIYTVTSTNAHYLTEDNAAKTIQSGLDELTISVDGVTQETYQQYRVGGQLDKVLEGTQAIVSQKKRLRSRTPHVVWQFVVFSSNEHQVEEVKQLGREMGVDEVRIKTAQVYDFENASELIPRQDQYSRYRRNAEGGYEIKNKLLNQCWRMWQGCVITWDGSVVPCCFDKDAKYKMGTLKTQSLRDVWFSPLYSDFRKQILMDRKSIDICRNCTEGTQVWS